MLLAFETVDRSGSLCVVTAAGEERAYRRFESGRAAAELPRALDQALRAHPAIERLAVAVGPGSFTGLRVGVVAARTLGWCAELPVVPVGSLAAIAAACGPGCWWVLMPLKRDTTFHACYRVEAEGVTELQAVAARADAEGPLAERPPTAAVAVGPALASKPGLAERWCPGIALGAADGCDARGVAQVAAAAPALAAAAIEPAYHMRSAPELQRAAREGR